MSDCMVAECVNLLVCIILVKEQRGVATLGLLHADSHSMFHDAQIAVSTLTMTGTGGPGAGPGTMHLGVGTTCVLYCTVPTAADGGDRMMDERPTMPCAHTPGVLISCSHGGREATRGQRPDNDGVCGAGSLAQLVAW